MRVEITDKGAHPLSPRVRRSALGDSAGAASTIPAAKERVAKRVMSFILLIGRFMLCL